MLKLGLGSTYNPTKNDQNPNKNQKTKRFKKFIISKGWPSDVERRLKRWTKPGYKTVRTSDPYII